MRPILLSFLVLLPLRATARSKHASAADVLAAATRAAGQGEFEKALKVLNGLDAQKAEPAVAIRADLLRAECESALHAPSQVDAALRAALRVDPSVKLDPNEASPELIERLEKLREELAGELSIKTGEAGWLTHVDDQPMGPTPLKLKIPAGAHQVVVTSPDGARRFSRRVEVRPGAIAEVEFETEAPVSAPAPVGQAIAPSPAPIPETLSVSAVESPPSRSHAPAFVLGGVSLLGVGAGIALGLQARSASRQMLSGVHSGDVAQGYHDQAQTLSVGANVGYGVAVAAGVTAVVLYVLESRDAR